MILFKSLDIFQYAPLPVGTLRTDPEESLVMLRVFLFPFRIECVEFLK